jgi:nickel-dependent lactate racemase
LRFTRSPRFTRDRDTIDKRPASEVKAAVDKDSRTIDIAYGRGRIPLNADPHLAEWHVVRPEFAAPLPDAENRFYEACRKPIASPPLREIVRPGERVVIVTSDGTRPVPNRQLIPWILRHLDLSSNDVTILLGNGSHRANTAQEIAAMFGPEVNSQIRILNHDAFDPEQHEYVGCTTAGEKAYLNRVYMQADRRIVVGFIEPHFFAGFSGGAKGIVPGIASIETILQVHSFDLIAHPMSCWGTVDDNPIRQEVEYLVRQCPPDFMVNVTLNSDKAITAVFAGDYVQAHRAGCQRAREETMQVVPRRFPLAITSNSGYPLDQNLYQAVKGISAAARVVEPGGTILIASECCDGIPDHGNFGPLMRIGSSPEDILRHIQSLEKPILDQWEAQLYVYLMQQYDIGLYSSLSPGVVQSCKLRPVADLQAEVEEKIRTLGPHPAVAVLPDGPLTIPCLAC